jgi:hypothetical protein
MVASERPGRQERRVGYSPDFDTGTMGTDDCALGEQ